MEKSPTPEDNFDQLSRERRAFREAVKGKDAPEGVIKLASEEIKANKEKLKSSGWSIEKEGGLKKAKERLKKGETAANESFGGGIDEPAAAEAMGERAGAFRKIAKLSQKLNKARDFEMEQFFKLKSDPLAKKANEKILKAARDEKQGLGTKFSDIQKENPKEFRAFELIRYAEDIYQEGHIVKTASVDKNFERISRNMLLGKPMFLHGPTGTGKTSQARSAAERFTGNAAEMVYCNPQMRESAVWGKTGIRPAKGGQAGAIETVDIFGPLAKAISEGRPIIFDEFTALPKEQMVFIKGIFNAKPGDTVNITGNGRMKITPGFQMIFTANLKSEKNPERQDLPPEIAREFEQNNIKINYPPKNESYEIMLARLMNPDGSIDASWTTLNETLPKLAEAMEEIQIAYTGTLRPETARITGSMDAGGKTPGLKKFVMTQGTIEAMFDDWKISQERDEKKSFAEHIDQRLKIGLTFEEYPLADRILAARILASKGFLRTLNHEELGLPNDVFNFDAAKKLRGNEKALAELVRESGDVKRISLKELADLDPFNVRRTSAMEKAAKMLGGKGNRENKGKSAGEAVVLARYEQETIELDIEKSLESFVAFYEKHNIDLPSDFGEKIRDIWARNNAEMQESAEKQGFDEILLIPEGLSLPELHEKMAEGYEKTYEGGNFEEGGSFAGVKEAENETRIVLLHKNRAQNLKDRPELEATLGKTGEFFAKHEEPLTLTDYLIYQRKYFEETNQHLDTVGWIWLPGSKSGGRFVAAHWHPGSRKLYVYANGAGHSNDTLGCRLSRCFK